MENRVYYGEYSLEHWIKLILGGNIKLPWYQRSFVWEENKVKQLISSFEKGQFVPPIIIGAVKREDETINYILDGQQRLTSILFAQQNKFINKKDYLQYRDKYEESLTADDVENQDEDESKNIKVMKWTFDNIIKDKKIDKKELDKGYYKDLFSENENKDAKFFKDHYMAFAYIHPNINANEEEQSKFYSEVFRNINTGATILTRLETRKALYFLKESLKDFFSPEFLNEIKVATSSKESGPIDFIKYLSILSQCRLNGDLYKYGGRNWEKNEEYYREYILAIVDRTPNAEYNFEITHPTESIHEDMSKLKNAIRELEIPKTYTSIIDMDMYFFGLVNEIIFNQNDIDAEKKNDLHTELKNIIRKFKENEQDRHKVSPGALKYLRMRIDESLDVYSKYIKRVEQ